MFMSKLLIDVEPLAQPFPPFAWVLKSDALLLPTCDDISLSFANVYITCHILL